MSISNKNRSKILSNRDKKFLPRGRAYYCNCDLSKVNGTEKCEVCGRRSGKKRLKQ